MLFSMTDRLMYVRQTLFVPGPAIDLMANILAPTIREPPGQSSDGDLPVKLLFIIALTSDNSSLQQSME